MKRQWVILLICLLLVVAGTYWLWPKRVIKNFPPVNTGPIVFFGDSLVAGVGASIGRSLPDQLSGILGESVRNFGVAGDTTADGLARIDGATGEGPKLVIVLLGGNDFLRKVDRTNTAANLKQIVTVFQNTGAVVLLIGVQSGIVGGGADEMFEAVANETGAAYEEDILKGVFGDPVLMSDTIHPNDRGYAKIAERLLPTVKKLLGK